MNRLRFSPNERQERERWCGIVMYKVIKLVLLVLIVMCGSVSAAETVPLPPNIDIVKPNSDVSVAHARFSGNWSGSWDNGCPVIIVVENIDNLGRAKIVFAQGTWPWIGKGKNPNYPFWRRLQAQFVSDKMSFRRAGSSLLYEAYINEKDGTMRVNRTDTRPEYGRDTSQLHSAKLNKTE